MNYYERGSFVINDLLDRTGEKLQLDRTRRENADSSYTAVTELLKDSNSLFGKVDIEIYPQGSFAIQTTVKPLAREEYDLDFVLEVALDWKQINQPTVLLDELFNVLKASGRYSKSCERKNRCVRLNYAGEFHMDILPACPNTDFGGTNIKVPDRNTKTWTDSNPKGFAGWFEERAAARLILEKAAKVEPIPDDLPYELKPPLKRAVQLLKRRRDIFFQQNEAQSPRSIILTTLAAMHYTQEIDTYSALLQTVRNTNVTLANTQGIVRIPNPSNIGENLADDWIGNPEAYKQFKAFSLAFQSELEDMTSESDSITLSRKLELLFGEKVAREVFAEHKEFVSSLKSRSGLHSKPSVVITNPPKPWKGK